MTLTIVLKNGKELTTESYPKEKLAEIENAISDSSVGFINFTSTDNGSILFIRLEDISAVLYGIS